MYICVFECVDLCIFMRKGQYVCLDLYVLLEGYTPKKVKRECMCVDNVKGEIGECEWAIKVGKKSKKV